jgi:hypothetical protein
MADAAIPLDFRKGLRHVIKALKRLREKLTIMCLLLGPHFFLLLDTEVTINLGIIEAVSRIDHFFALDQRILLMVHSLAGILIQQLPYSLSCLWL